MNGAGARELEPARVLALGTSGPGAEGALRGDVGARLDEREERRDEADFRRAAEEGGEKLLECPLQVRHRDAALDDERLDLVKDRRVGGVHALVAVDAARGDDPERRPAPGQLADLD